MKLAILHYHLKPGGVCRIIQSQLQGLSSATACLSGKTILAGAGGGESSSFNDAAIEIIPEFNYLTAAKADWPGVLEKIRQLLRRYCDSQTLLHVHNANLGKNPLLTLALAELAEAGQPLLLHCHDFAEDRPELMEFMQKVLAVFSDRPAAEIIYPLNPHCFYAVLNRADRQRLLAQGIPAERLLFLPNPVELPEPELSKAAAAEQIRADCGIAAGKMIVTYPVRPIRRKNLGEFMLLAAKFADRAEFLLTLEPKNPTEVPQYESWRQLAEIMKLPVHLKVGAKIPFPTLLRGSDFCLTTSIREGFGMSFLEPWLAGTPVVGRDLPMVTADFRRNDLRFPQLYNTLPVTFQGKTRDFPEFSIEEQQAIVKAYAVAGNDAGTAPVIEFPEQLWATVAATTVNHNIEAIRKNYSLTSYSDRLHECYQQIIKGA